MDWLSAAYDVVTRYPGGVPAMAPLVGVAVPTLYNALRGEERHDLSVRRFGAILHHAAVARVEGWDQPLHALAFEHDRLLMAVPRLMDGADNALTLAALNSVKEFGDLASVAAKDVADGDVSRKELEEIEREGYEAIAAIVNFIEQCRAAYEGRRR